MRSEGLRTSSPPHTAPRACVSLSPTTQRSDKVAVDEIEGAKGNFEASGQLQIIFGTGTVNKVFDEFIKQGDVTATSKDQADRAVA
jgi:PTS system sucrose-specific IIC component